MEKVLTWRSCFSHLGATLGMASFYWAGRRGTPVRPWGGPVCMAVRIDESTGSFKVIVFSIILRTQNPVVRHFVTIELKAQPQYSNKRGGLAALLAPLTDDGVVLDAEQLGLVVSRDCGVRVHVSGQHGQAGGHIRSLHPFFFLSPFDLNVV